MTLENAVGDIRRWRLGRKKVNGSLEFNKCFIQASVIPNILINCKNNYPNLLNHLQHPGGQRGEIRRDYIDRCFESIVMKKAGSTSSPAKNETP